MKPLCIVSEHPELEALVKKGDEVAQFFRKRAKDMDEEIDAIAKEHWAKVKEYLSKHVSVSAEELKDLRIKDGVVYHVAPNEPGDLAKFLHDFIGKHK